MRAPRFHHRSRSHASAHADEAAAPAHAGHGVEHPLVHRGPPQVVTDSSALAELVEHLRSVGTFAYDSEFIGELTYIPRLCLIQVATHKRVALIDPLADGMNLAPFWDLLCDAAVEKVVHAGQQDVEPVFRHAGRPPANLFDTQIAAGFVGLPYPLALSKLVNELVGARLGKGLTFTDWSQRPLSNLQLRYAADDVRFLPAARAEFATRLTALGHAAWAREESDALADESLYRFNPDAQYLKIRGAGSLPPHGLAVLRALANWRDQSARAEDVPPRTFLRDEILLDMARTPIKSVEKLARVRGLPRPVEANYGKTIVDLTQAALALPPAEMPEPKTFEPSPREKYRGDALWSAAQAICFGRSIDPAVVTSRQDVGDFLRRYSNGGVEGEESKLMRGWRRSALGEPLLAMLRGDRRFTLGWVDGDLRTGPAA